MLVVKVELHSAITGEVSEIGRMRIINDGTAPDRRGNYNIELMRRGANHRVQRSGRVFDHPRLTQSVWQLVAKALESVKVKP